MPFDTACPECSARLRLDAPPDRGAPVECPKCGALFVPPRPKKAAAPPPADEPRTKKGKAERAAGAPAPLVFKRKVKKKKTNPVVLVAAIALGFGSLVGLGAGMMYMLNRAGKVEEMLTYVPGECNWARGVNVSQLSKYPGYAPEVDKHLTADVRAAVNALADAADQPADKFLDYFVVAKSMPDARRESTMYVFRSQKAVNVAALNLAIGGSPTGGPTRGGKGVLVGATLYTPAAGATTKVFVVVPAGSESLKAGVLGGKENSFAKTGLDATGGLCVRGSIWLVGRSTGRLKGYTAAVTALVGNDLPALAAAGKNASTFGVWTTPGGGGVRCGVAMQCADAKTASDLVRSMKDGPLGRSDESEPTNQLKSAFSEVAEKKFFSEFMQMLSYRTRGECAYFVSSGTEDKATKLLTKYNSPTMATDAGPAAAGGFQSPQARGGNDGASRGGSGVGGIAPPGLAGPGGP